MSQVQIMVDIVESGKARIGGPGFAGYVATIATRRTGLTNRPAYSIILTDDTAELPDAERAPGEPMPPVTRARRKSFAEACVDMARKLASHYGHTDVSVTVTDETTRTA